MEYTTLGSTGMKVSRLCLGCLSFGGGREWGLTGEESREIIDRAVDLGINYFDTANRYGTGDSEEILGTALEGYDRDWTVVATKVYGQMDEANPNSGGLSRKAIEQELDNSLRRLGMDTVDLYQSHRWDYETPIEQTLRALDDAVHRGKVRYVGTSSQWAYQFAHSLATSDEREFVRFQTMQNRYNLVYREEEREMLPLCETEDVGVVPWSPLAAGYLARPDDDAESTNRGEQVDWAHYRSNGGVEINERVQELAAQRDLTMAQVSLAWLLHKDVVDAPIVGATSVDHLEDAVEAVDVSLSDSDIEYLEEPYEPKAITGHR